MARLIYSMLVSLDGFTTAEDGGVVALRHGGQAVNAT